jgi:hypothetical protein
VEGKSGALAALWARGRIRDLEDAYASRRDGHAATEKEIAKEIEREIVATSLRHGVLSRFTAYVAVDRAAVVEKDGELHRVVQPVELPAGWEMPMRQIGGMGPASSSSMGDSACIFLPALEAQAELRAPGEGRSHPAARRDQDSPSCARPGPTRGILASRFLGAMSDLLRKRGGVPESRGLVELVELIEAALKDLRAAQGGAKARKVLLQRMVEVLAAIVTACAGLKTVTRESIEGLEKIGREIEAALKERRLDPADAARFLAACETALAELLASLGGRSPPVRPKEFWR